MTTEKTTVAQYKQATIYREGGFGYSRIEAKNVTVQEGPYAQYPRAQFVTFLRPFKRSIEGFVRSGISGKFLIVEGWGHPDLADCMGTRDEHGSSMTRRGSFDPGWQVEFDAFVVERGLKVAFDGRASLNGGAS
jgi:hypothetical protein